MAQISSTILSGSILLPTTENTSSAGNIWFDGTNVKYSTLGAGTWSAGGALITGRSYMFHNIGTQTATLSAGGQNAPGQITNTEEYNGSSWSAGGAMSRSSTNASQGAGAGTQNAGIAMGGFPTNGNTCTEEYNGSSWSTGGSLITSYRLGGGAGTQNSSLYWTPAGCSETYNGTSWSAGSAQNYGDIFSTGVGTQNAGLKIACNIEEYNGTSWSTANSLITPRREFLGAAGEQISALAYGGCSPGSTCTEKYNGTSWSSQTGLITARLSGTGGGTSSNAIGVGGNTSPSYQSCTEEYNQSLTACTL